MVRESHSEEIAKSEGGETEKARKLQRSKRGKKNLKARIKERK